MTVIQNRIETLQQELGQVAGADPLHDRKLVGAIAAYSDLLHIDFEEVAE